MFVEIVKRESFIRNVQLLHSLQMLNLVWWFRVSSSRWSWHSISPQFLEEHGPSAWGLHTASAWEFQDNRFRCCSGSCVDPVPPAAGCQGCLGDALWAALGSFGLCSAVGEPVEAEIARVWFCRALLRSCWAFLSWLTGQWEVILIPERFSFFSMCNFSAACPLAIGRLPLDLLVLSCFTTEMIASNQNLCVLSQEGKDSLVSLLCFSTSPLLIFCWPLWR